MADIHYLVFSGGGAAGAAYGGALQQLELEPEFSMQKIKGVAGASAGAITALLVGLGYTAQEITQKLRQIDFSTLEDGGNFIQKTGRLLTKYGKYRGSALFELVKSFIKEKFPQNHPEKITFQDIKNLTGIDLYIVTTKNYRKNKIFKNKTKIFCTEKHWDTPIADVIHASAAAPVYYSRLRLRKIRKGRYELGDKNCHLFSDGGVKKNYPIDIFDHSKYLEGSLQDDYPMINPHVLGFALLEDEDIIDPEIKIHKEVMPDNHPFQYFHGLISSSLFNSTKVALEKVENRIRTVQIDRKDVSLADFNLKDAKKEELIESGIQATKRFFEKRRALMNATVAENITKHSIWEMPSINNEETETVMKHKNSTCTIL
jgi:NTE family protein